MLAVLAVLAACGGGEAVDPRAALRARLAAEGPVPTRAEVEERLVLGLLPAACAGARARVRAEDETEDWRLLLLARARLGAGGEACLGRADADAMAAWAAPRPEWRGALAEWSVASGRLADAEARLAAPGEDGARLRLANARGDGDGARIAAEGALIAEPRDVLACRTLALAALEEQDPAWAIDVTRCGGVGARAPELVRLAAEALDRAGEHEAAAAAYGRVGADVHRAAILYQEGPTAERLAEAARLLAPPPDGPRPPAAALHAAWMALRDGAPASLEELDDSIPALVARGLARGSPEDLAALAKAASAPTAIARARIHARRGERALMEAALADALRAAPAADPVHRARIALRIATGGDVGGALAEWASQDPDHVGIVGVRGSRDLPWDAIVPETWAMLAGRHPDPRMRHDAPTGSDAVGARVRAARVLPDAGARADALGALARDVPGLDALAAERYRLGPPAAGVPDHVP